MHTNIATYRLIVAYVAVPSKCQPSHLSCLLQVKGISRHNAEACYDKTEQDRREKSGATVPLLDLLPSLLNLVLLPCIAPFGPCRLLLGSAVQRHFNDNEPGMSAKRKPSAKVRSVQARRLTTSIRDLGQAGLRSVAVGKESSFPDG